MDRSTTAPPSVRHPEPVALPAAPKYAGRARAMDLLPSLPRPLVFTNGVFDLLHRGHVENLRTARALGATLVVGLNTDASARRLSKGPGRPIHSLEDRAAVLSALESVTLVVPFDEDTPLTLIEALRPDLYVKGGDYDIESLPEAALVRCWGGRALALPYRAGCSTSAIVDRVRAAYAGSSFSAPEARASFVPRREGASA